MFFSEFHAIFLAPHRSSLPLLPSVPIVLLPCSTLPDKGSYTAPVYSETALRRSIPAHSSKESPRLPLFLEQ